MSAKAVQITADNLVEELANDLPEYRKRIEDDLRSWTQPDPPGLHIICPDILNPAIETALASPEKASALERLFAFVERMAQSQDPDVVNVVEVSICEGFLDRPRVRDHMGPATLAASMRIEAHIKDLLQGTTLMSRIARLFR